MATLSIGALIDDAAITADPIFTYTALTNREVILTSAHLCAVRVERVFSNGVARQEGTVQSGESIPTSVVPAGSQWRFTVQGEPNPVRFIQVDIV